MDGWTEHKKYVWGIHKELCLSKAFILSFDLTMNTKYSVSFEILFPFFTKYKIRHGLWHIGDCSIMDNIMKWVQLLNNHSKKYGIVGAV